MASIEQQIQDLEDEIRKTQYNKATQHHIGKLKAKIAKLREEAEQRRTSGIGVGGRSYAIKKTGNASIALVGFPSAGKSTLLNRLTNAESEVGAYQFTTLDIVPGIMDINGAQIQVLDLPGLIEGAARGRGRGREVLSAVRNADLCVLLLDVFNYSLDVLIREVREVGIRLDEHPPDIVITRSDRGGITINSTVEQTIMDDDLIKAMLKEYGIVNASLVLRENINEDQLVDFLAGNRVYIPKLVALNKIDLVDPETLGVVRRAIPAEEVHLVSAEAKQGLEELKTAIFDALQFIRIYMKPQGQAADMVEPLVVKRGTTVEMVCNMLHRDFARKFRYARVWGVSAKFPGQNIGLNHVLADEDVLSIILRR